MGLGAAYRATFKGIWSTAVNFAPWPSPDTRHGQYPRITDDPMILLDTMDLEARGIVHGEVHEHHRRKEGENHSRCGRGC